MSEETNPAKKAARKSVRKKSASKRAPRKSAQSESDPSDEQLPLDEAKPVDASSDSSEQTDEPEKKERSGKPRKGREPKSGVRDARREPSDDPESTEVHEKLVPDETSNDEKPEKNKDSGRDQNRNEQNENRGRNRGRGRGRGQDRPEKREPQPRVSVDGKEIAKKAWKIFESEVTEEGLALLDDNGLRDYARSSFNAARIFLEEEGRVTGRRDKPKKKEQKKDEGDD